MPANLEPVVGEVLKPKRALLLQRIAEDIKWPDVELFNQLREVFDLVGNQGPSVVFAADLRPLYARFRS